MYFRLLFAEEPVTGMEEKEAELKAKEENSTFYIILFLISAAPKQSRTVSIPLRRKNTSVSHILHTIGVTLLCIVVFLS